MANPSWARWIVASIAKAMQDVAVAKQSPCLVDHVTEQLDASVEASDHVEVRVIGPRTRELSKDCWDVWADVNVLVVSRHDGPRKNAYDGLTLAGAFHAALDEPLTVFNYGSEPGDYQSSDPTSLLTVGCLTPGEVLVREYGQPGERVQYIEVSTRFSGQFIG